MQLGWGEGVIYVLAVDFTKLPAQNEKGLCATKIALAMGHKMSDGLCIFSSTAIEQDELLSFLKDIGGYIISDSDYGQIDYLKESLWVSLDNSILECLREDDEEWTRERDEVVKKLGVMPQAAVIVESSDNISVLSPDVQKFIRSFATRWPCVVSDLADASGGVYSVTEVCEGT